jgi:hypothetical protein
MLVIIQVKNCYRPAHFPKRLKFVSMDLIRGLLLRGISINYRCLKPKRSEKYLNPRRLKKVNNLEYDTRRTPAVYTGHLVLLA